MLGLPADAAHAQREEGEFVSPGLWVDRWHVTVAGHGEADGTHTFVFTHALTPVDETHDPARVAGQPQLRPPAAAERHAAPMFERYYRPRGVVLEPMQQVIDDDGRRREVRVAADAAASAVRRIMERLVAEETGAR